MGLLLVALLSGQDPKLAADFKESVSKLQSKQAENLAAQIAAADGKWAVQTLVGGYDVVAQAQAKLLAEKAALQREADQEDRLLEERKRLNKKAEDFTRLPPPSGTGARARIAEGENINKAQKDLSVRLEKVDSARTRIVQIETSVIEVEKIKRAVARALGRVRDPEAVQEMIVDIAKGGIWTARAAVAEAMASIDHSLVVPALVERCAKEQEPLVLAVVLDSLRAKGAWTRDVLEGVAGQVQSPYWQVQISAAKVCGASKAKETLSPLLQAMEKAKGRVLEAIHEALVSIAGVDKGYEYESWKTWFEANKDSLVVGTYKPRADEAAGPAAAAQGLNRTVTFYGIPVRSHAFVILLDRSGSMAEPGGFDEEEERVIETAGGVPGAKPRPSLRPDPRMRKIDVAKYQVKKVLYNIENGTKFNLIWFNHTNAVFQPAGMATMSEGSRSAAIAWIELLEPYGETDTWGALQKAIGFCAEPGPDGRPRKEGADTVYIMTDGTPEPPGKVLGTNEICDRVREWNRLRKVAFNTVYVSAQSDRDYANGTAFMRRLAEENGGTCKIPKNGGGRPGAPAQR